MVMSPDFARTAVQHSGADSTWDPGAPRWVYLLDDWGPWVLGAIALVLLVRALLHHRRYRAMQAFDTRAQSAVHAALESAEMRTIGEIVPVVVERSDRHP